MGWPYEFLTLTKEDKHARRIVLDRYGRYGAFLVLLPAIAVLAHRLVLWAVVQVNRRILGRGNGAGNSGGHGAYNAIPNSPSLKSSRLAGEGRWAGVVRRTQWWLSDDVVLLGQTWGQRDQWVVGALWTGVLLVLCFLETGRDYLHLTKRFGIVAVSQFPVQYVLGLKCVNPFVSIFRASPEELNRWHRVLGVIVYGLLLLHTVLYLNFFVYDGGLPWRLFRPVVFTGLLSILGMTLLSTTALGVVRRYSYRVFFITHVVVAFGVPLLLLYHAHHANPFTAPSLLVMLADVCMRKIHTVTTQASVEAIPGTDLVRVSAPLPSAAKAAVFQENPAAHVYVSLPGAGRPSPSPWDFSYWLYEFIFNPFTIAAVSEEARDLTLVVRTHKGPLTSALLGHSSKAALPSSFALYDDGDDDDKSDEEAETAALHDEPPPPQGSDRPYDPHDPYAAPTGRIPINIEGPYGSTMHFPELSLRNFDRVLLVAGGVGATFAVPLYRAIVHDSPALKVDFVWSVRGAGDATWALMSGLDGSGKNLLSDRNVHIFLTGTGERPGWLRSASLAVTTETSNGDVEGPEANGDSAIELGALDGGGRFGTNRRRPDLRRVVDDIFRNGTEDRVAVLVCGPEAMVQDLRKSVGVWVKKGRTVWWHNESFGW